MLDQMEDITLRVLGLDSMVLDQHLEIEDLLLEKNRGKEQAQQEQLLDLVLITLMGELINEVRSLEMPQEMEGIMQLILLDQANIQV